MQVAQGHHLNADLALVLPATQQPNSPKTTIGDTKALIVTHTHTHTHTRARARAHACTHARTHAAILPLTLPFSSTH